jgi:CO/xanthine dehydrogenase FAD-binding subunit
VASRPLAAQESADFLTGKQLTPEIIAEAARLTRKVATPMDNTDFQTQWRGTMVQRYTEAALRQAAGMDPGRLGPKHGLPVVG